MYMIQKIQTRIMVTTATRTKTTLMFFFSSPKIEPKILIKFYHNLVICSNTKQTSQFLSSFIVIQQIMGVTRWIVLQLLPKTLYELGFFEGIVRSGKTIRQITRMIY